MKKILFIVVFFSLSIYGFAKLPSLQGEVMPESILLKDGTDKFKFKMEEDSILVTTNFSNEDTFCLELKSKNNYKAYLNFYKLKKVGCFRTKYYAKRSDLEELFFFLGDVDKITFCNKDLLSYSWFSTFSNFQETDFNKWLHAYVLSRPGIYAHRNFCCASYEDQSRLIFFLGEKGLWLSSKKDFQYGLTIEINGVNDGDLVTRSVLVPFNRMSENYAYNYLVQWGEFYNLIDEINSIIVRDNNRNIMLEFNTSDLPNNFENIYYAIQSACVTNNYFVAQDKQATNIIMLIFL